MPNEQFPTRDILQLGLAEGDPGAAALLSRRTAAETPTIKFNLALMSLLKRYQTLGTRPFEERALGAEAIQARRLGAEAEPGMAPGLQRYVREARVGAVEPTVAGARERGRTFAEQLRGFGDVLEQSRLIASSMEESQRRSKESARELIFTSFTLFGGGAFEGMDEKELEALEKTAGFPKGYVSDVGSTIIERETMKEKELADTKFYRGQMLALQRRELEIKEAAVGIGKQLAPTQVEMLSDAVYLPTILDDLEILINKNRGLFHYGSQYLPFSERRATIDDDLRRAAQLIGKFMEGGVLRKEDEIKYAAMLPKLGDMNADVALDKLEGVRTMLTEKYQGYLRDFEATGYDVSGFTRVDFGTTEGDLRSQVTSKGYNYDQLKADGYSDEEIRAAIGL